ncbi:hypothetical protein M5C72_07045 [Companilactobacillus allii]|uniref:Uncharacterized protein n=1 Tax=Companilactobacillus allii TaxID=1847728 RepID=A0A1P8Q4S0_9LACO|nr:hypothetical protein [Companilactobacillus allii]APX72852.1 hypothetical protein BTM29_09955 [Companilactobacillus allii]USQ67641.1 hypothetical protein M5C72_07045 [Companilactobacillus allii]
MATSNKLTRTARVASHAFLSAQYEDKKGNVVISKPVGDGNTLDLATIFKNSEFSGGTSGGGGTMPTDSTGLDADYTNYIGSTKIIWSNSGSNYDISQINKLNIASALGTNSEYLYDGLQFNISLKRTAVIKGVKGTSTSIPLIYDRSNSFKVSKFITTTPIPISLKKVDLSTGNDISISLDGMGENINSSGAVLKPKIIIKLKSDNTLDIQSVSGYDLNMASGENSGAYYDIVVNTINSFEILSTPITQYLPDGTILFDGSTNDSAKLSNLINGFSNVGGGIEVTLSNHLYYLNSDTFIIKDNTAKMTFNTSIKISKEKLIDGNSISDLVVISPASFSGWKIGTSDGVAGTSLNDSFVSGTGSSILIQKNAIKSNVYVQSVKNDTERLFARIEQVKTYLYDSKVE